MNDSSRRTPAAPVARVDSVSPVSGLEENSWGVRTRKSRGGGVVGRSRHAWKEKAREHEIRAYILHAQSSASTVLQHSVLALMGFAQCSFWLEMEHNKALIRRGNINLVPIYQRDCRAVLSNKTSSIFLCCSDLCHHITPVFLPL